MRMQADGTTLWALECGLGHLYNLGVCIPSGVLPCSRGFILEVQPRFVYRLLPSVPMLAFGSMCANFGPGCCCWCVPSVVVATPVVCAWEAVCWAGCVPGRPRSSGDSVRFATVNVNRDIVFFCDEEVATCFVNQLIENL